MSVSHGRAATQDEIRRHNLARLIRRLHSHGATSRSDLVGLTGLNRSTVGVLVSELAEAGLVAEAAGQASGIGRPSLMVEPIASSAVVLAFELRVERTVAALVGLGGTVFQRREIAHHRRTFRPATAARQVAALAQELLDAAPIGATWVGTGISIPGAIDRSTGIVRIAPNLAWFDTPIKSVISAAMAETFTATPPMMVGNDADHGALAEVVRGVGRGRRSVLYVIGDVGVGAGVVLAGSGMVDAGGLSGEVGHMVVNPQGAQCHCGARGCWETEIGRDALLRAAGLDVESGDPGEVIASAAAQNSASVQAMRAVAHWVDIGLGNLVNIFNPEVIVLGGHLRDLHQYLTPEDGPRTALSASRGQARICLPGLGEDSIILGAAESAMDPLLQDPLGTLMDVGTRIAS